MVRSEWTRQERAIDPLTELLGDSPAFEAVKVRVRRLLASMRDAHRAPLVLIQGETGTGKGLLARTLHNGSTRSSGPFVAVNCAAIPDTLAETELFGFEAGAHSQARRGKPGLFQAAARGTIFLDEIGLLSEAVQSKLLTVIEDRRVRRVGSTRDEAVDVWIISATNADLLADVRERKFRSDLYQRLAVVVLVLPPLRERVPDILALAEEFVARTCRDYGLPRKSLSPDARVRVIQHTWPGNIRELSNVIERAVLLSDSEIIGAAGLELAAAHPAEPVPPAVPMSVRDHHLAVLEETGWNISHAALRLGITRKTLRARIERLHLRDASPHRPAESDPDRDVQSRFPPGPAGARHADIPAEKGLPSGTPAPGDQPEQRHLVPVQTDVITAAPTPDASAGSPGPLRPLRWERRRLTVLRVYLVIPPGADPVSSGRGALNDVLEKARMFGGRLEGLSTTWATISFGTTQLEESSNRAAHAALSIQRAAAGWIESDSRRPAVIATIETAHLLVAHHDGRTVEIDEEGLQQLQRQLVEIAASCEVGWIVAGPQIQPFLERRFQLVPIEGRAASAIRGHRLVAPRAPGQGELSKGLPFVGRAAEVALLNNRFGSTLYGHGQVVAVVGEPGVGKSRLLAEFCRSLVAHDSTVLHTGASFSNGPSFLPAIELLRRHLSIEDGAGEAEVRAKVGEIVPHMGSGEAWSAVALAELLGVPSIDPAWTALAPTERREQTLRALRRVFIAESERHPLVLIFEDLHWIDTETQALIDMMVEAVPATRILLLVTYRPEYQHHREHRLHYSELWLEPLTRTHAAELLDTLMGDDVSVAATKARLIDFTEGNPFFIEEAVRYLATTGALAGVQGHYHLMSADALPQIPPTIEDVLAERIDRLAPDVRSILESAAVFGREGSVSILSAVVDQADEMFQVGLQALHAVGLLLSTGAAPEAAYRFKHPLTHDVAYGSLLPERRRLLHEAVFQRLEAVSPAPQGEALDHLAFHAFHGEAWEPALTYCRRAGERAYRRSSNAEAVEYSPPGADLPRSPARDGRAPGASRRRTLRSAMGSVAPGAARGDGRNTARSRPAGRSAR